MASTDFYLTGFNGYLAAATPGLRLPFVPFFHISFVSSLGKL
jgi:hypothetical protein